MITFQNRIISTIITITLLFSFTGCKKASKGFSEKFIKESTEESTEMISKKFGISSLRHLEERSIKNLNLEDFIYLLKKEFPTIYTSFSQLDNNFQKEIIATINESPRILDIILSSKNILDEFVVATLDVPALAKNSSFFFHYVTHPQFSTEIILKQVDNTVNFISKNNNKVLGKYKDGVLNILEPFTPNGHTFSHQLLNNDLIPNTLYKVKGQLGTLYQLQTDAIGNVVTAQGRYVSPEDMVTNILRRNNDINLGESWPFYFKKIKQHSTGEDLNVSIRFKYTENNPNPRSIRVKVSKNDKEIVNKLFENTNHLLKKQYTSSENISLLKGLQKKLDISNDKINTLSNLMNTNDGFANFIHSNPEFNIKRWNKTRNHVDIRLIKRTPKGRFPPNAKVYAGNVYYFHPYLNPGLANRLSNKYGIATLKKAGILSREQLEELDRLYPKGVPFSKSGFPDFSGVAAKDINNNPIAIDIKELSGDSKIDIAKAETLFQALGNKWEDGFTWHHIEGTTSLLRVPTVIHQLIDHAGGMAMSR